MARFQYNKFLEHSGKPKKPPRLLTRTETNRISFRIDEEEQINDTLWQYGDGNYGTAGFKMKSGRFAKGTRIAATWSDKQFTSWVESFHLKPLREEFVFSVDGSTIEVDFDLDLVLPNWVMVYYYDDYSWDLPKPPPFSYQKFKSPDFGDLPDFDIPELIDTPSLNPNYVFDSNNPVFDFNNPNFDPNSPGFDPNSPDFDPGFPDFDPNSPDFDPNFPEFDPNFPDFDPNFPEFDPNPPPDIPVNPPGDDPDGPPDTEDDSPVDEPPDATDVVSEIPEGTDVPLLAITLSPKATRHNTPEVPLVFTVSMLNFNGETEPVDYDMLVPLRVMGSGVAGTDYELSGIIPSSAFGDGPASRFDVGAFALIPRGQTSVDVRVTPLNPANQDTVDITLEVMPLFAFTKNFNPIDNPDIGSPEGTNPLDVNTVPDVEALQTGYLTPSLLTANYTFEPAGEGNSGDDLNLEDRVPESDECRGTSQSAPYVPDKGFYLGTLRTQVIASGDIEAYPSTTATLSLVPQDPDATQYWDLGDPVNLQVSTVDGVKTITVNVTAGAVNNDEGIVHEGSIPIVTSDPFQPTNINIVPSESGKENERIPGTQRPGMPGYRPSPTGSNPTTLGTTPGVPSKYSFNSPPLWDYQVSFPPNAPPGAFIKPSVGVDAIKSNPYPPSVIQFPSARDVNVPAQVWTDSKISALPLEPLACLNYQLQIFLELYSTYPNDDPEDTTVRIPEGHEDPLQIIIRIVLLGDVREDYSSEEMPLAVSLAGTATPDTDYTILGEGQTPISGTEVLADYQFSENVLGVYVPAGVLNAQLKEVTIQVPVAILLDEEEEGDETIEVTPLFPEQPEEGSTPLILWESYETTIAIILGQLADILYNFKVLQDGGKLEGFGQNIGSEQVDIIAVNIPEVIVGGGATYTFPQDSELFVCYVYLQLSDAPLGSSITANVYNTSLPGSPTILDSILTVPAGQTRSNPVTLDRTIFNQGDVLQVAILSVGSESPGAGMQLFLGRKYGEGEEVDWERVGLTNTGNGYIVLFKKSENEYLFVNEQETMPVVVDDKLFANNNFFISNLELSPCITKTTIISYPALSLQSDGGGTLSGNIFLPTPLRYAGNISYGNLFNTNYFILNEQCTTIWDLTTPDNVNRGTLTQVNTYTDTGRTDTSRTWNYSYTGSYTIPHNDFEMNIDGSSVNNKDETVTVNVTSVNTFDTSATRKTTTTETYNNTRKSTFTLGTEANPTYGQKYDVTASGNITVLNDKPKIYKVRVRVINTYQSPIWGSDDEYEGGNVWNPTLEGTVTNNVVVISGEFYALNPTVPINYVIESESYTSNAGPQTTYYFRQTQDYYPIGTDWYSLWKSSTRIRLNDEIAYHFITSQAGLVIPTGYSYTQGAPSITIEYDPPEEVFLNSANLYDGTSSIVENTGSTTADEQYLYESSQNAYIKNGVDCLLYVSYASKFNQTHVNHYSYSYNRDYDTESTFDRYQLTEFEIPNNIDTLKTVIKNQVYSVSDYKNGTIDGEDRYCFVTSNNDYNLEVGSITFGGFTVCGTTYNPYAVKEQSNAPQKEAKLTFTYYFSDAYFTSETLSRFTVNTFTWVNKPVEIYQAKSGVIYKAVGVATAENQANAWQITVNIQSITIADYHFVVELGKVIICSPTNHTSALLYNFNTFAKRANLYVAKDENDSDILELAISEQKSSNNNFGGAVLLEGQNVSVRGNNYGADWQGTLSEPSLSPPTQSVWYKWVAPSSNAVVIHTLGSPVAADYQVDTVIAVYTGSSLDNLSLVASNDDASVELPPNGDYLSAVVINPTEGTTYYIQVDGWGDTQWSFVLSITTEGLNVPTPIQEETRRADIYRFDTQTLKWKRMPNAVSAISPLTAESDFISYHATPQTETLTDGFICPEE